MANLQTRLAVAALTGGGGGGLFSSGDDQGGLLAQITAPCNPTREPDEVQDDIEQDLAPIPEDKMKKYLLRIYVHSGSGFASSSIVPGGVPYCTIVLGEGTATETTESSNPVHTSKEAPFFGYLYEKEITVEGRAPDCEIRLMEQRLIKDTQMGACKLQLPDTATDGPKRMKISVYQADTMLRPESMVSSLVGVEKPAPPKLSVVYQMVALDDQDKPDLQRIAEMDASCTLKRYWTLDLKLNNVKLKRPTTEPFEYRCKFQLIDRFGNPYAEAWSKTVKSQQRIESKADKLKVPPKTAEGADKEKKKTFDIVNWGATAEAGEEFKWSVYQSQINLMSYILKVTLEKIKHVEPEKKKKRPDSEEDDGETHDTAKAHGEIEGYFEERVGDLLDSLDERDHRLLFNAELAAGSHITSAKIGLCNMEVDIYTAQSRHRQNPIVTALDNLEKATEAAKKSGGPQIPDALHVAMDIESETPTRVGWHKYTAANDRDVTYSVNCWVTGLQSFGDVSDPYVRVRMGKSSGDTEKRTNEFFSVFFKNSPKVKAKMSDRKAILEVWDSNSRHEDRLVGSVSIYNVESDRLMWFHMYGGAMQAPRKDEAQAMVRGAIKPGSTYQGSIAVTFSTRAKPLQEFSTKVNKHLKKRRLCVRLYRGLYLPDKYRGKNVNVIVQVAGGFLPVGFTEDEVKMRLTTIAKAKKTEGQIMNRSVLTFPGEVDSQGRLRFKTKTMGSLAERADDAVDENTYWIQRSTPKACPLDMPPNVRHCYLYIVVVGEEEEAPELFTRLRLNLEETSTSDMMDQRTAWAQHNLQAPKWKRIRFDRSVTSLDNDNDFGGFILGSAVLMSEDKPAMPDDQLKIQCRDADTLRKNWRDSVSQFSPVVPKTSNPGDGWDFFDDGSEQLSKGKLFPKSVMPRSVMCRPCMGEVQRCFGSLGEPEELLKGILREGEKQTIFAHIDVIACRSLNSTDADGLCDPCYRIEVESSDLDAFKHPVMYEVPKSLNPTFNHRMIICVKDVPLGRLINGKLPSEPLTPFPPIVFTLLDKDSRAEDLINIPGVATALGTKLDFLGQTYDRVGIAWLKDVENLDKADAEYPTRGQDELSPNEMHKAMWLALDAPARKLWEAHAAGNEPMWVGRPRVLIAAGFSTVSAVIKGSMEDDVNPVRDEDVRNGKEVLRKIETKHCKAFEIAVDLLGIRNLPGNLFKPELSVTSSWLHDAIQLNVDVSDTSSPNFDEQAYIDFDKFYKFSGQVKSLISLKAGGDPSEKRSRKSVTGGTGSRSASGDDDQRSELSSAATSVDARDLVGVRLGYTAVKKEGNNNKKIEDFIEKWNRSNKGKEQPPDGFAPIDYEADIIPYLQPKTKAGAFKSIVVNVGNQKMTKDSTKVEGKPNVKSKKIEILAGEYYITVEQKLEGFLLGDRVVTTGQIDGDDGSVIAANTKGKVVKIEFGHYHIEFEGVTQVVSKSNLNKVKSQDASDVNRIETNVLKVTAPSTWKEVLEEQLEMFKLDTERKRQFYLKCTAKKGRVFPFSKFSGTFSTDDFPLTVELMSAEDLKKNPVVMMPDLVFQLKSKHTGMDYGTLSMPFTQPPLSEERALQMSWSEISCGEYEKIGPEYQNIPCLKEAIIEEKAYKCFVDVYACKDGYIMWDKNFFLGRSLRSSKIFTVYDDEMGPKLHADADPDDGDVDPPLSQFFNPADWMIEKPEQTSDEAYGKRETPCIACAVWDETKKPSEPGKPLKPNDLWISERVKNKTPLSRKELWQFFFEHVKSNPSYLNRCKKDVFVIANEFDLCRLSTKLMSERMLAITWRCTSHLNSPDYSGDRQPAKKGREDIDEDFLDDPAADTLLQAQEQHLKKCHTRTFMRPIGHIIDPFDRDSRTLCRLRMGLPEVIIDEALKPGLTGANKRKANKYLEIQKNLQNYLTIRFEKEAGVVIWAAPLKVGDEEIFRWSVPGTCLFCVKLDSGIVVQVTVPNFDLRFPHETAWFPCKTMYERFGALEKRIQDSDEVKLLKDKKVAAEKEKLKEEEEEDKKPLDTDVQKLEEIKKKKPPKKEAATFSKLRDTCDGISKPIRVVKYGFVCRIRKKQGSNNFDRVQTKNWWRTVLKGVFPEVHDLVELRDAEKDRALVKDMFMQRFLNLRENLVSGSQRVDKGLIKGHISVTEQKLSREDYERRKGERKEFRLNNSKALEDSRAQRESRSKGFVDSIKDAITSSMGKINDVVEKAEASVPFYVGAAPPSMLLLPVDQLWRPTSVNVFVYVLSASDLKLTDGTVSMVPSVSARVIGKEVYEHPAMKEVDMRKSRRLGFYEMFALNAWIPGDNALEITIHSHHTLSMPTVVGKATIDLEDRWMALQLRQQRMLSNKKFIMAHRYYEKDRIDQNNCLAISKKRPDPVKKFHEEATARLKQLMPSAKEDESDKQVKKALDKEYPNLKRVREDFRNYYWLDPLTDEQLAKIQKPVPKSDPDAVSAAEYHKIKSKIGPPDRMPVEIINMVVDDEDTGSTSYAGTLRLWVDMQMEAADYHEANVQSSNDFFEIRIVCRNLQDITVFRDAFAERNDAFVTAKLKVRDYTGKQYMQIVHTDTHVFATSEAAWNWQWVFLVHAPADYCEVEFGVFDSDRLSGDDPIYNPKTYPLDHMLMLAFTNARDGKPSLGVLHETIIFDDWDDEEEDKKIEAAHKAKKRRGWCCAAFCLCCALMCRCCGCGRRKVKRVPARLHVDIQILPKEEADRDPKESGVCITPPAPPGRLGWKTAIAEPGKFVRVLVGPSNMRLLMRVACALVTVLVLVTVLMCFFFFMQGTVPIFKD